MPFPVAAFGAIALTVVVCIGYWLAGWSGSAAAFLGYAVGGFVGAKQLASRLQLNERFRDYAARR